MLKFPACSLRSFIGGDWGTNFRSSAETNYSYPTGYFCDPLLFTNLTTAESRAGLYQPFAGQRRSRVSVHRIHCQYFKVFAKSMSFIVQSEVRLYVALLQKIKREYGH